MDFRLPMQPSTDFSVEQSGLLTSTGNNVCWDTYLNEDITVQNLSAYIHHILIYFSPFLPECDGQSSTNRHLVIMRSLDQYIVQLDIFCICLFNIYVSGTSAGSNLTEVWLANRRANRMVDIACLIEGNPCSDSSLPTQQIYFLDCTMANTKVLLEEISRLPVTVQCHLWIGNSI